MKVRFPNESSDYRTAREALLKRELQLRREMESVATELRALSPGGEVPEDYLFDCISEEGALATVPMSGLFRGGDTLMLYHFMFPRHAQDTRQGPTNGVTAELSLKEGPCPSCTALIDMWEGTMPHFEGLGGNLAIVAKAPMERLAAFARDKGWKHIRRLGAVLRKTIFDNIYAAMPSSWIIFMQLCRAHGTLLAWLLGARRSARLATSGCGRRVLV